jgi:hypothetical protein
MRRLAGIVTAATLATLGVVTATAGPASASVPGPECDSGGSRITCEAIGGVAPITWTVTVRQSGYSNTFSFTTANNLYSAGCAAHQVFTVSFAFTSGGVTQTSAPTTIACNTGPWA